MPSGSFFSKDGHKVDEYLILHHAQKNETVVLERPSYCKVKRTDFFAVGNKYKDISDVVTCLNCSHWDDSCPSAKTKLKYVVLEEESELKRTLVTSSGGENCSSSNGNGNKNGGVGSYEEVA